MGFGFFWPSRSDYVLCLQRLFFSMSCASSISPSQVLHNWDHVINCITFAVFSGLFFLCMFLQCASGVRFLLASKKWLFSVLSDSNFEFGLCVVVFPVASAALLGLRHNCTAPFSWVSTGPGHSSLPPAVTFYFGLTFIGSCHSSFLARCPCFFASWCLLLVCRVHLVCFCCILSQFSLWFGFS